MFASDFTLFDLKWRRKTFTCINKNPVIVFEVRQSTTRKRGVKIYCQQLSNLASDGALEVIVHYCKQFLDIHEYLVNVTPLALSMVLPACPCKLCTQRNSIYMVILPEESIWGDNFQTAIYAKQETLYLNIHDAVNAWSDAVYIFFAVCYSYFGIFLK